MAADKKEVICTQGEENHRCIILKSAQSVMVQGKYLLNLCGLETNRTAFLTRGVIYVVAGVMYQEDDRRQINHTNSTIQKSVTFELIVKRLDEYV